MVNKCEAGGKAILASGLIGTEEEARQKDMLTHPSLTNRTQHDKKTQVSLMSRGNMIKTMQSFEQWLSRMKDVDFTPALWSVNYVIKIAYGNPRKV